MKELIKRLERAAAGSRELDWAIRDHLGLVEIPIEVVFGRNDGCWVRRVGEQIIDIGSFMDSGATSSDAYLPRYTTSIDAALTLVPNDGNHVWTLYNDFPCDVFWAVVTSDGKDDEPDPEYIQYRSGDCASPALALCIAAMKARASCQ